MTAQRHRIVVEGDDATNYSAYSPDVPGVVATGATREECERELREAIEFHLEGLDHDVASGAADAVKPLLAFENVSKRYESARRVRPVFDRVSFEVRPGERIGILGSRRSGKSTLLRLAAGIDSPSEGTVRFEGHDITAMSAGKRERLMLGRFAWIGEPAWPPQNVSVEGFVLLPLLGRGLGTHEARRHAHEMLHRVGMADRSNVMMHSLPLGDRLWVTLAHALSLEPSLLIVDEPAVIPGRMELWKFLDALRSFASEQRMALMIASEEPEALLSLDVLMSIEKGELHSIEREAAAVIDFPTRGVSDAECRKGNHSK
ncbi:MAG TPA: ATP-binding cassette domain-containing protein, partial [Solirubrobacteraceae bacterium]|jgi:ABC-type lipoprotein export system ATPase subunit/predicted RNase H-like HicB family nuclease|nr:ATP-binding cassette domain-containing protein [Solirubrobacteraceae bacterium]